MPDRKPPFGAEAPGPIPRHSRTYAFVVDDGGRLIEVGSGRFARVFMGEERRVESETGLRRPVVIKMLAKGVGDDEAMRFRSEQQLLARGPRDSLLREPRAGGRRPRASRERPAGVPGDRVLLHRRGKERFVRAVQSTAGVFGALQRPGPKRLVLKTPFAEIGETNIRARVQKSVGRPADIYSPGSIGALFYYLVSGAYGNPKALCDALHKTGRRGLLGSRGAMAGGAVRKLYDDALSALGLRRKP